MTTQIIHGKRKAIEDYFDRSIKEPKISPYPRVSLHNTLSVQRDLQPPSSNRVATVPGLTLIDEFITATEERVILDFLNDPAKCTWRTDLSRRTMHFGGTYCLMQSKTTNSQDSKPQILQAPEMPEELSWLIQRFVDRGVYPDKQRPQYCIVNEYTGDLGISAHTENFQFGEPVVGLSLLSPCSIRFTELTRPFDGSVRSGKAGKAEKTGSKIDVNLPGRSLLVMRGDSRWKWQHEIVRSAKGRGVGWKRVSLTFRYKDKA